MRTRKSVPEMSREERRRLALQLRALGVIPDRRFSDVDPGPLDERCALRESAQLSAAEVASLLRIVHP